MHHEWIARVVHDHVLGQVEELANRLVVLRAVLTSQEQKVMIEKDHSHYFYQTIMFEGSDLAWVLIATQVFLLEQTDLL